MNNTTIVGEVGITGLAVAHGMATGDAKIMTLVIVKIGIIERGKTAYSISMRVGAAIIIAIIISRGKMSAPKSTKMSSIR